MNQAGLLLGCIADDLTGATDIANTLARRGMTVVQTIGVPAPGDATPDAEAIVVALKSRTIPASRCGRPVARRLPLAEGQRRAAVLFQILLDLRFNRRRQYRPRRRCADGRAQDAVSPSPVRPFPRPAARSIWAICSWESSCSRIRPCAITR